VEVDGRAIALFRVAGAIHAVEDTCLHAGGPLSEGALDGPTVTCPWHGWQYDVTTGACALNPLQSLERFPVRVRNGIVELEA
jgi:nitrite reductase/ring-hydroxylating ferredoxin subunit